MPNLKPAFSVSRLLAASALALLAGCATNPPEPGAQAEQAQEESDDPVQGGRSGEHAESENRSTYPDQELTENLLYEYLLAEIAGSAAT